MLNETKIKEAIDLLKTDREKALMLLGNIDNRIKMLEEAISSEYDRVQKSILEIPNEAALSVFNSKEPKHRDYSEYIYLLNLLSEKTVSLTYLDQNGKEKPLVVTRHTPSLITLDGNNLEKMYFSENQHIYVYNTQTEKVEKIFFYNILKITSLSDNIPVQKQQEATKEIAYSDHSSF